MGGLTSTLFGGKKEKASSEGGNHAYDYLKQQLGGNIATGNGAMNMMAGALGVGGDPAVSAAAAQSFMNSAGHQFQLDQGGKAITGSAAARGLLQSGSTGKALTSFGQQLGQQNYANYLNQLGALNGMGMQSAQMIGSAGQYNKSRSSSTANEGLFAGLTKMSGMFGGI